MLNAHNPSLFEGLPQSSTISNMCRSITFCRFFILVTLAFVCCSQLTGCGFVSFFGTDSSSDSAQIKKATVIETACSQIGKKYKAGGDAPHKGFDCSGLVWWSYKQHGIKVPRITKDQAKAGHPVKKRHVRPGDIMVFKTSNSPNGLHTGLYCGKGKFVHSPSRGKSVCIEKLDGSWWGKRLVAIRRVR